MTDKTFVADTPDGIEYYQLCTAKQMVKLESKGMKHSSGRSARKAWAERLGMRSRASYEEVIEKIQRAQEFLIAAKQLGVTKIELTVLAEYAVATKTEWAAKLSAAWTAKDPAIKPELNDLIERKGLKWLAKFPDDAFGVVA